MRRNHYLIEFRFHGYAKKYLKRLIFGVSKKFKVKGVTRKRVVPHITYIKGEVKKSRFDLRLRQVITSFKNPRI